MKRLYFLVFLLINLIPANVLSQDVEIAVSDTVTQQKIIIPINEITSKTEELSIRFSELYKELKPSSDVVKLDSLLSTSLRKINEEKTILFRDSSGHTYRNLEKLLKKWSAYEAKLANIQNTLKSRTDKIETIANELRSYLDIWQNTHDESVKSNASTDVIESEENVISTINSILVITNSRSDTLFLIQRNLTEQALIIDDVIRELNHRENFLQINMFIIEGPPIWEAGMGSTTPSLLEELRVDKRTLISYIKYNLLTFIAQVMFLILLLVYFIYLYRKWIKNEVDPAIQINKKTRVILSHPLSSVLAIGLLISAFFFANRPPVFGESLTLIILASTIFLLPKFSVKRLYFSLFGLFILLLLNIIGNYLGLRSYPTRLIEFASIIFYLLIAFDFRFNSDFRSIFSHKWGNWIKFFLHVYLVLNSVALLAIIFGSVNLADFLFSGILFSTIFAAVTWLVIEIFSSVVLLVTLKDPKISMQTLSSFHMLIQMRAESLLKWIGIVLWVYLSFISFNVLKYIKLILSSFVDLNWRMGQLTISVGGIISFLLIITATVIITRLIKNVLSDDWVEKTNITKGSSGAISIVLRIIVTIVGIYLASSAAGIDLSQLGFIVGALSVGIGFGLQSVVLNFIAGLILSFERPIKVGDTIEVDAEMGVVKEIGIRASTIKTFSGSDVIIPNGDLVSKKVVNYTLSDEKRRFKIPFKINIDANPQEVMRILIRVATEHPDTLIYPAPNAYLWGYENSSLDFFLYFWTEFNVGLSTRNAVILKIYEEFKKAGIKLAIPMRLMVNENGDEKDINLQSS